MKRIITYVKIIFGKWCVAVFIITMTTFTNETQGD